MPQLILAGKQFTKRCMAHRRHLTLLAGSQAKGIARRMHAERAQPSSHSLAITRLPWGARLRPNTPHLRITCSERC